MDWPLVVSKNLRTYSLAISHGAQGTIVGQLEPNDELLPHVAGQPDRVPTLDVLAEMCDAMRTEAGRHRLNAMAQVHFVSHLVSLGAMYSLNNWIADAVEIGDEAWEALLLLPPTLDTASNARISALRSVVAYNSALAVSAIEQAGPQALAAHAPSLTSGDWIERSHEALAALPDGSSDFASLRTALQLWGL